MLRRRVIQLALASVVVSVAGEPAIVGAPAAAQSSLTTVGPLPQRRIEPTRRRNPTPVVTDDDPDLPPPAPVTPVDDTGDGVDASEPGDGDDLPRGGSPRARDGDAPAGADDTGLLQDGLLTVGEPRPARDGAGDLDRDARLKADVDAFEQPAAGYDALAFQIDGIDPLLDRRPARLARFEPYNPIGIRRGSWLILPELELGAGATSNVRRSPSADGTTFFDSRATVRAVTDWRQHALDLRVTGFGAFFSGFSTENDRAYGIEARGRFDVSRRTNIEVLASHQRDRDSRQSRDALDSAVGRAAVETKRAAVAFNHRFNRLSVQLRGSITDVDYDGIATISGGFATNDQRDVAEIATGARATWAFKPTLLAFTDITVNDRHYRVAPADGIGRDSRGVRAVAGVSFGSVDRIWRGEVSAGYGRQDPDDARLQSVGGFIFDANLAWRISPLTSLLVTARTDFNDSTTVGQSGSRAQTFGLEARHAYRRHLIGIASVKNTLTAYRGVALDERETTAEMGLDYFLNRTTTLSARYAHVDFSSSAPGADYAVETVRFGVRIRQ